MQYLIDRIIKDMSSFLLTVTIVTMVPMETRWIELCFDRQFYKQ